MATVLIADDSLLILKGMERALRKCLEDLQVETALDGKQALAKWKAARPDLTFLDINMPEVNGVEVLRQIKAADPNAKVFVLSADRHNRIREQCTQLGANGFIQKGSQADLVKRLESVLGGESGE